MLFVGGHNDWRFWHPGPENHSVLFVILVGLGIWLTWSQFGGPRRKQQKHNERLVKLAQDRIAKTAPRIHRAEDVVIHQMGEDDFEDAKKAMDEGKYVVYEFPDDEERP
jgi:hypothetical protein